MLICLTFTFWCPQCGPFCNCIFQLVALVNTVGKNSFSKSTWLEWIIIELGEHWFTTPISSLQDVSDGNTCISRCCGTESGVCLEYTSINTCLIYYKDLSHLVWVDEFTNLCGLTTARNCLFCLSLSPMRKDSVFNSHTCSVCTTVTLCNYSPLWSYLHSRYTQLHQRCCLEDLTSLNTCIKIMYFSEAEFTWEKARICLIHKC